MVLAPRREIKGTCVALAGLLALLICAFGLFLSPQADALETAKTTARPNGDSGSEVYGGSETRITWEGQASADEAITQITLSLPANTSFGIDDARVTLLSGDKLMDRTVIHADVSSQDGTFVATFPQAQGSGGYFRIELYEVFFPASGGLMPMSGTYTLADGSIHDFSIDPIDVTSVDPVSALAGSLEEQEWVRAWNDNKFLRLFFNPPLIVSSIPVVFNGFLLALAIVAVSFPTAIPIGLMLSFMRMASAHGGAGRLRRAGARILRGIGSLYVNVVRGTPLFLQIYIAFFGLPLAGINIQPFFLGWIVLSMNSAAYMCEIFRAGIQSIPKGQFEAARSLGMNGAQTMIFVIIPQTISRVIPTLTSEFILLYKDTSMLAAVGVMEMVYDAKMIVASTGSITPYIVAACFYLIITLPLAKLVGNLERKLNGMPAKKRKKGRRGMRDAGGALRQMHEELVDSTDVAMDELQEQARVDAHLAGNRSAHDMDDAIDELQHEQSLDAKLDDAAERGGT